MTRDGWLTGRRSRAVMAWPTRYLWKKVRFLTVDGRDVSAEDAKKQLATWNPILIGTMLPPDYVYPTPAPLAPDFAQTLGREQAEAYRSFAATPDVVGPWKAGRSRAKRGHLEGRDIPLNILQAGYASGRARFWGCGRRHATGSRRSRDSPVRSGKVSPTHDGSIGLKFVSWAWKGVWETRERVFSETATGDVMTATYKVSKMGPQNKDGRYSRRWFRGL